ncbi:MAG: hypothetical protein QM754_15550 [Tepidisphaeraceae bacterium]
MIQTLVEDLAGEQPVVAAVDLGASASRTNGRTAMTADGDTTTAREGDGYVAYRHLGTTTSGLHVLIVMANGGGSGVFEDVLWVRLVRDVVKEDGTRRDRTMLLKVGSFTLGDRDDGYVRLDGKRLLIGKSKYRPSETVVSLE